MELCAMCRNYVDVAEPALVAEDHPICSKCEAQLDCFLESDNLRKREKAQQYLQRCTELTDSQAVADYLEETLEAFACSEDAEEEKESSEGRFACVYYQEGALTGVQCVLADRETGVQYLWNRQHEAGGMTVLLGPDGKPLLYKGQYH